MKLIVHSCEDLKNVDSLGKNDPYVKITMDHVKVKTTVKKNAGRGCVWNESFNVLDTAVQATFVVKDKGFLSDTVIGENTINLADIKTSTSIPIFLKGAPTGTLTLSVEGRPGSGVVQQHMMHHQPQQPVYPQPQAPPLVIMQPPQPMMYQPPPQPIMMMPPGGYGYPPAQPQYPPPPVQASPPRQGQTLPQMTPEEFKAYEKARKKALKKSMKKK